MSSKQGTKETEAESEKPVSQTQAKQEVPTANFFDTLDWSSARTDTANSSVPETVEVKQQPKEDEFSLLDDQSDNDNDFATLRSGRNQQEQIQTDVLFDIGTEGHETNTPDLLNNGTSNQQQVEEVDFFNMGGSGTDPVIDKVDLLDINDQPPPSNIDLLSGTMNVQPDRDLFTKSGTKPQTNDTFDPFQAFTSDSKAADAPPVKVTAPANDFGGFDPFGSSGGNVNEFDSFSSNTGQQTTSNSNEPGDLMGGWDSFMPAGGSGQSSPNISRNSSASNLLGSGSYQPMGGGNIPRNNSGTFQGMGGNIPRSSSGTYQPMGGMGQRVGSTGAGMASVKSDPFADLGMCSTTFFLFFFQWNNSLPYKIF